MVAIHLAHFSKFWLSLLLGLVCLIGDNFVAVAQRGDKLVEALADNVTHGLVGALSALIVVAEFGDRLSLTEQKLLVGAGYLVASGIDVDHFIAARSFRLSVIYNLLVKCLKIISNIDSLFCRTPLVLAVALFCTAPTFRSSFCSSSWVA